MRLRSTVDRARKWLYPGLGVKRWLILLGFGLFLLSLGVSFFYVQLYRMVELPGSVSPLAQAVTLQFLPHIVRGTLLGGEGVGCVAWAVLQLSRSLVSAFHRSDRESVVDVIYRQRVRQHGPSIVTIGGGTGLSVLLRGLKERADDLTAIVTVADDGGSSGRLRRELGLLPPGDFRNCIAALAEAEPLMTLLFQYRFGQGVGLDGHSFGNLFIAAMAGVTGDFGQAVRQSSRVLAVRGRVLPSTMESVTLCAEYARDHDQEGAPTLVHGESRIPEAGAPIERVFLQPQDVRGYGESVRALLDADIIVVGPGSLYTSLLPNLLVKDVASALHASSALKIYVCNLATQRGETDGYDVGAHVRAIYGHVGEGLFDFVLANSQLDVVVPEEWSAQMVRPMADAGYRLWTDDLVDPVKPWRHDPRKLAKAVMDIHSASRAGHERRLRGSWIPTGGCKSAFLTWDG